ncbi:putative Nucleoside diphosphate-linked moiety X motif 8 [Hypsibius exemplaris]|uniref:Nucleoside diphosphate-linked moiety X motif 8 n=1 Tax=Hypsibius exemplaris TaxID=2072580 RepID=A0A1W0XA52_HYPEX|nr:putative Nucleoside diphosphate-linked moiety X motif 8 [Hypsibius exemplaris]
MNHFRPSLLHFSRIPAFGNYFNRNTSSISLSKDWNFASAKDAFVERAQKLRPVSLAAFSKPSRNATETKDVPLGYATLVPLCVISGVPGILFTLRSANLYKHRGEISLPGGRADKSDKDLIETAVRETEEEIGFPRDRIQVWASLPAMPTRNSEGRVTSVVGFCGNVTAADFRPNPTEVAEIFFCSLDHLCRHNGFTTFRKRLTMPVFHTGKELDWRPIWGMTAVTIETVLKCLVPDRYPHRRLSISPTIRSEI